MEHASALSVDAGFREMSNVFATELAVAVSVAVVAFETEAIATVKFAEAAPAGTVTVDGTVNALLLLARETAKPPEGAADVNATAQVSVPAAA